MRRKHSTIQCDSSPLTNYFVRAYNVSWARLALMCLPFFIPSSLNLEIGPGRRGMRTPTGLFALSMYRELPDTIPLYHVFNNLGAFPQRLFSGALNGV